MESSVSKAGNIVFALEPEMIKRPETIESLVNELKRLLQIDLTFSIEGYEGKCHIFYDRSMRLLHEKCFEKQFLKGIDKLISVAILEITKFT